MPWIRGEVGGRGPVQGSSNSATGADPRGQLSSSFTSLSISSRRDGPSIPAEVRRPPCPTYPTTDPGKTWVCNRRVRGPQPLRLLLVGGGGGGVGGGAGRRQLSELGWAGEEGLVT